MGVLEWALIALIFFAAWRLFKRLKRSGKMSVKDIEQFGIQAEAIILSVEETGLSVNNISEIKVQMQVQPDKGRNFVTEVQQVFLGSGGVQLHSGSKVIVKYDPGNPKEVVVLRAV